MVSRLWSSATLQNGLDAALNKTLGGDDSSLSAEEMERQLEDLMGLRIYKPVAMGAGNFPDPCLYVNPI